MQNRILFLLLCWLCLSTVTVAQEAQNIPYQHKLEEAESLLRSGNIGGAIALLDEVTRQYPDASDVFYAKSLLYGQMSNYEQAIENARTAYDLAPTLQNVNLLLDLYRAQNKPDEVLALLTDFRSKNPERTFVSRELISTLMRMERMEEAGRIYDEEVAANRGSDTLTVMKAEMLLQQDKAKEAIALLTPLAGRSTFSPIYGSLAFAHGQQGKSKTAVQVLERGLKITNDPLLYLDLATVYHHDKKYRQMYDALQAAFQSEKVDFRDKYNILHRMVQSDKPELSLDQMQQLANMLVLKHPRIAESHILKGNVLWQRGSIQEARSLFLTAVGINPNQLDAWRMLINADMSLKEVDEAIRHGQEAVAANPGNPMLLYFTGLAYLMNEEHDSSRALLERALDNSENENNYLRSVIYGTLGDLYHQLEMHAASDIAYDEALTLDSTNVTVLNNYAYYLAIRKKDLEKAERYSRLSNELQPGSPTLQDTYAWVMFQQGRYQEALSWIEKALRGDATAVLLEHYGDILSKMGREKDALKQWERALAIHEGSEDEAQKIETKIKERKYVE